MSTEVLVTIIIFVLGLLGVLVKMIRDHDLARIAVLERKLAEVQKQALVLTSGLSSSKEIATNQVDELIRRVDVLERRHDEMTRKHDENGQRFGHALEQVRDHIGDMRETIAGFGAIYITRREYSDEK